MFPRPLPLGLRQGSMNAIKYVEDSRRKVELFRIITHLKKKLEALCL